MSKWEGEGMLEQEGISRRHLALPSEAQITTANVTSGRELHKGHFLCSPLSPLWLHLGLPALLGL